MMILRFYHGETYKELCVEQGQPYTIGCGSKDHMVLSDTSLPKRALTIVCNEDGWSIKSKLKSMTDQCGDGHLFSFEHVVVVDENKKLAVTVYKTGPEYTNTIDISDNATILVGRSATCDVTVGCKQVSGRHLKLERNGDTWKVLDLESVNGVYVEGNRITERIVRSDDVICFGFCSLVLVENALSVTYAGPVSNTIQKAPERKCVDSIDAPYPYYFKQSPRLKETLPREQFELQSPPAIGGKPNVSWLNIILAPALTVCVMIAVCFFVTNVMTMLYFSVPMTIIGAIVSVMRYKGEKKKYAATERLRLEKYNEYLSEQVKLVERSIKEQQRILSKENPSILQCLKMALETDRTLWSRRRRDEDFMSLRVGEGTVPASVTIKSPKQILSLEVDQLAQQPSQISEKYGTVDNCPILIDLGQQPTCGIIGDRGACVSIGKNLVVQAATHHSYNDLRIVVICDDEEREDWSFCRWLPHLFDDTRGMRYFADTKKQADKLLTYFDDILNQRALENQVKDRYTHSAHFPYYLFVCASAEMVGNHPIMKHLTSNDRTLGVGAVFLFDSLRDLPTECEYIVDTSGRLFEVYKKELASEKQYFTRDMASADQYDTFARALAPLRVDVSNRGGELPTNVSFLQGYRAKKPQMLDIAKNWSNALPEQTMEVPIGVKKDGSQFTFDVHEKRSGPHGLVAGMTGSGKSEMVQSWILSMAVQFPPSAVSFVLIDFKGTGLLLPFKNLPHLAGTISDLDTNIGRNLIALENELTRRKALLDQYQVSNISSYLKLVRQGKAEEPLPYLFIVIDEFAEFKVRFPDFMQAVNRVFAIGRTLGVHMILLTQKPANIVDDKMNANTRFRWCLKVANSSDSRDMLRHTDAAKITNPGRAFVQVGEDEIFEEIQTYWSGAPYNPYRDLTLQRSTKVAVVDYYGNRGCYESEKTTGYRAEKNEIDVIVEHLDTFARQNNYDRAKAIWTNTLSAQISLNELLQHGFDGEKWSDANNELRPAVGLLDDPRSQSQYPLYLDFANEGHVAVFGAPGSGKTTFLHTLIMSLALSYSPEQVHMYMMDFGGGSLNMFKKLPHVGGIAVGGHDDEKIKKLTELLLAEIDQRRSLLAKHGLVSVNSYFEATGESLPYIVLLLDNFSPVLELYPELDNFFQVLARDGGSCGIYFVTTAGTVNALGYRINQYIKTTIALRMQDRNDYAMLVGRTNGLEPEDYPGRGLVRGNPPLEFQTALPVYGRTEVERVKNSRDLIELMSEKWDGVEATLIPTLPDVIRIADYRGNGVLLGLRCSDCKPVFWDVAINPFLVISSAEQEDFYLPLIVKQVADQYKAVKRIQFDPAFDAARTAEFDREILELMPLLQARKEAFTGEELSVEEHPYVVVVIDDLKKCFDVVSNETMRRLASIVTLGRKLNVLLVVSGGAEAIEKLHHVDTFTMNLVKCATTVIIGGKAQMHRAIETDLSYSEAAAKLVDCEAFVVDSGIATKIRKIAE